MKQITGITKKRINDMLATAAAFTLASMTGSGALFGYIVLTQGPRLNHVAGNIAATLAAVLAMAAIVLVAICQTMHNINRQKGGGHDTK